MRIGLLLLGAVCLTGNMAGQPASDLLQSGIYNQETAGDLDAAIRIYRQILSAGPAQRLYAAQAQYRLGECLLRKGDKSGATRAFQAVIRDYADQTILVARARENMPRGDGLLPAPWKEYEVAEYRWTIPGVDDAWSITHIAPPPTDPSFAWIHGRFYIPGLTTFDEKVDRDTMRPALAAYSGAADRTHPPGGNDYEFGEVVYLLRRMPLRPGWRATIPVILRDGGHTVLTATVAGLEDVAVPAGTFPCFKVRLSVPGTHLSVLEGSWPVAEAGETLWYATDTGRTLVKMESGASRGELTGIRIATPGGQTVYHDARLGISLQVPSDWIEHTRASFGERDSIVDFFNAPAHLSVRILVNFSALDSAQIGVALRAIALGRQAISSRTMPHYTPIGRMEAGTLGGHPSLSWTADYVTSGGRKSVEYVTCVQSQSTSASILVQTPADDAGRYRAVFQPIVDSFRMR